MKAFRIAPEEVAGKYQRQRDEAYGELREREASRKKVLEWIGNASILEFLDRVISYINIPTVSSNTLVWYSHLVQSRATIPALKGYATASSGPHDRSRC
jgi:hypothetical protein